MVVWVGLVCFVLGANLGFLVAGLMRMAKDEKDTSRTPRRNHKNLDVLTLKINNS